MIKCLPIIYANKRSKIELARFELLQLPIELVDSASIFALIHINKVHFNHLYLQVIKDRTGGV